MNKEYKKLYKVITNFVTENREYLEDLASASPNWRPLDLNDIKIIVRSGDATNLESRLVHLMQK